MECALGQEVTRGDRMGGLGNSFGRALAVVKADRDGMVVGRTGMPLVNAGNALVHIGARLSAVAAAPTEGAGTPRRGPPVGGSRDSRIALTSSRRGHPALVVDPPGGTMNLTRRTLVRTGAWSAPVVLAAGAAPAVAASGATYDLNAASYKGQMITWYTPERDAWNRANLGVWTLENTGTTASPATGVTLTVSWDRRLWGDLTDYNPALLSEPTTTTDGDLVTAVFAVIAAVEPGQYEGPSMDIAFSEMPEDGVTEVRQDYLPMTIDIATQVPDADPSNDTRVLEVKYGEVTPWNGAISGTFDTVRVECSDGAADIAYPSTITVTSDGPNPVPADISVYYFANSTYVDDGNVHTWGEYFETFRCESATLDGQPVTLETRRDSAGLDTDWSLNQPIPAGSVLQLQISATGKATSADPVPTASYGGIGFDESETNDEDNQLRAPEPVRV